MAPKTHQENGSKNLRTRLHKKTPGKSFTKNIRKTTLKNAKNKASLEVNHVRAPTTTTVYTYTTHNRFPPLESPVSFLNIIYILYPSRISWIISSSWDTFSSPSQEYIYNYIYIHYIVCTIQYIYK